MMNRRSALVLAVLTLVLMPRVGQSQGTPPVASKPAATLGQNYPNPFNPHTRLPFTLGDPPTCSDAGKRYRVTLRVYNILAQVVAVPQLEGSSGGVAGGQKLQNVLLPCGRYTAFWDGKYLGTSREVASGVYIWRIEVNGRAGQGIKSTVAK